MFSSTEIFSVPFLDNKKVVVFVLDHGQKSLPTSAWTWLQQQFSIQLKASICVKDFFAHSVPRVPEAATLQVCFFDLLEDGGSY